MMRVQAGFVADEVAEASRVVRPRCLLTLDRPCIYVHKVKKDGEIGRWFLLDHVGSVPGATDRFELNQSEARLEASYCTLCPESWACSVLLTREMGLEAQVVWFF